MAPVDKAPSQPLGGSAAELRILRLPEVIRRTGMSKTAIYDRLRKHEFPEPLKLGPRAVGFVESEVNGFLAGLMRQRSDREQARV